MFLLTSSSFKWIRSTWRVGMLLIFSSTATAQHSDIAVYQNDAGRVSTHASTAGQAESNYFIRNFDFWGPPLNVYAGDDPGFQMSGTNPPNGYTALPADDSLGLNVVPFHVPGAPSSNLLFWDGISSEVEFDIPPTDHVMFLEDAASTEITLSDTLERFQNLIAGVTSSSGGLHEHLTFAVENAGMAPVDGFYMMGWRLAANGLEDSKLVTVVLSTASIPATVDSAVSTWLAQTADSITMSGDFDDNGRYELTDVDALVAAIASNENQVSYDLDGDGFTDQADLTLWRTVAGDALNTSGSPILEGDANLDGLVDGTDFAIWSAHKFTASPAWSSGDFNADGLVNGSDFLLWNSFKSTNPSPAASVVPELTVPAWPGAAALAWLCIGFRRRRT